MHDSRIGNLNFRNLKLDWTQPKIERSNLRF